MYDVMKHKLSPHKQHEVPLRRRGILISFLFLLCILLDVFMFPESADIRIFSILGMYLLVVYRLKIRANTTLFIALLLLIIAYVQFLYTDQKIFDSPGPVPPLCERTAVWLYLFMVMGVIQKWRE